MIQQRWLKSSSQLALVLLVYLSTVDAFEEFYKLCPRGNITVISANTNRAIVTPDKCFPTPVVHRNELSSKPRLQILIEQPKLFTYTAVMVEFNTTLNKYELYWMEPNLTINMQHFLMQNTTRIRDIRKMIEYRPPKASAQNLTYFILVYRQSAMPVESPPSPGPFRPQSWAMSSRVTLIGGATFKVLANVPVHPAHHQPLPPPALIPGGAPFHPQPQPPGVHVLQNNYTFGRNYTNHTYPAPLPPYYPAPPPSYNYPPSNPYNPPPYHPPNQFYPPSNNPPKKGKGAAVDLQAATSLIIVMALLSFVLNV